MSDFERAHCRIYGRVQGVFFRANTRKQARRRGLTGWVKNLADGSVEAVIEGPREEVEEVVEWARGGGPERARVDDVDVEWTVATGEFDSFVVDR